MANVQIAERQEVEWLAADEAQAEMQARREAQRKQFAKKLNAIARDVNGENYIVLRMPRGTMIGALESMGNGNYAVTDGYDRRASLIFNVKEIIGMDTVSIQAPCGGMDNWTQVTLTND